MNIQEYLRERNLPFEVRLHEPAIDAPHMAHSLHVTGREVAKTVVIRAKDGYVHLVVVLPATRMINLHTLGLALGYEVNVASKADVVRLCPDCEAGVAPPFGAPYGMTAIVDQSLAEDEYIVFQGNSQNEAMRMKFADFYQVERPRILAVSEEA